MIEQNERRFEEVQKHLNPKQQERVQKISNILANLKPEES